MAQASTAPLAGLKVVEFAGLGPGPMCGMLLAELGADVLRLDRTEPAVTGLPKPTQFNLLNRSRPAIAVDLKSAEGIALAKKLIAQADGLIEGFRPGTMERLGLGPDTCHALNPKLVYGRVTGWGQTGPLAPYAGHDLNYIAITGALDAIGRRDAKPTPPLNLVGDFGGGALYLALGMVSGMLGAARGQGGSTIDAAMVDGATSLMTAMFGMLAAGMQSSPRGSNFLDSGAPYYDVYACADGRYLAVAALEPKFRAELFSKIGIDASWVARATKKDQWPEVRSMMEERFLSRTRDEWCALLEHSDCCVSPVLTMTEAQHHPHMVARRTLTDDSGVLQPAPAPRFSSFQAPAVQPVAELGQNLAAVRKVWNLDASDLPPSQ